jgi:hypothetical protein
MAGLVPAISLRRARLFLPERGHRDKPGDDKSRGYASMEVENNSPLRLPQ